MNTPYRPEERHGESAWFKRASLAMTRPTLCSAALILVSLLAGCAIFQEKGADWPMPRADAAASGTSPDRQIRPPLAPSWEFRPEPVSAPPLVAGGNFYAAAQDGALYAVSATNGKLLWQAHSDEPATLLAISENILYAAAESGSLSALNRSTGKLLWHRPMDSVTGRGASRCVGLSVARGAIYLALSDGRLCALRDGAKAEVLWTQQLDGPIAGGPAVHDANLVVTLAERPAAACLDARSGEPLWQTPLDTEMPHALVYAEFYDAVVLSGKSAVVVLERDGGALRWRFDAPGTLIGSPAVAGGLVVVACNLPDGAGRLMTLDVATGKKVIDRILPGPAGGAPIIVNHVIYLPIAQGNYEYIAMSLWDDTIVGGGYSPERIGSGGRAAIFGANRLIIVTDIGSLRIYRRLRLERAGKPASPHSSY